jgi:hypothetical protein
MIIPDCRQTWLTSSAPLDSTARRQPSEGTAKVPFRKGPFNRRAIYPNSKPNIVGGYCNDCSKLRSGTMLIAKNQRMWVL